MDQIIITKSLPRNVVIHEMRIHDGELFGYRYHDYDGKIEDMVKVAQRLAADIFKWEQDISCVNSRIIATDENGQIRWGISPNFEHVAEVGTDEFRYILGDMEAK